MKAWRWACVIAVGLVATAAGVLADFAPFFVACICVEAGLLAWSIARVVDASRDS